MEGALGAWEHPGPPADRAPSNCQEHLPTPQRTPGSTLRLPSLIGMGKTPTRLFVVCAFHPTQITEPPISRCPGQLAPASRFLLPCQG